VRGAQLLLNGAVMCALLSGALLAGCSDGPSAGKGGGSEVIASIDGIEGNLAGDWSGGDSVRATLYRVTGSLTGSTADPIDSQWIAGEGSGGGSGSSNSGLHFAFGGLDAGTYSLGFSTRDSARQAFLTSLTVGADQPQGAAPPLLRGPSAVTAHLISTHWRLDRAELHGTPYRALGATSTAAFADVAPGSYDLRLALRSTAAAGQPNAGGQATLWKRIVVSRDTVVELAFEARMVPAPEGTPADAGLPEAASAGGRVSAVAMAQDASGELWLAQGGLFRWDGAAWSGLDSTDGLCPFTALGGGGQPYVDDGNRISYRDASGWHCLNSERDFEFARLLGTDGAAPYTAPGELLLRTHIAGTATLVGANSDVRRDALFPSSGGTPRLPTCAAVFAGNLFVGSDGGGLARTSADLAGTATGSGAQDVTSATPWSTEQSSAARLPSNGVNALLAAHELLWIGTDGGIALADAASAAPGGSTPWIRLVRDNTPLPDPVIRDFALGAQHLWIATPSGPVAYEEASGLWAFFLADPVTDVEADTDGNLRIATDGGLFTVIE